MYPYTLNRNEPSQLAHDVEMTSYWRRCDVITSHRYKYNVITSHVPAGLRKKNYLCRRECWWCRQQTRSFVSRPTTSTDRWCLYHTVTYNTLGPRWRSWRWSAFACSWNRHKFELRQVKLCLTYKRTANTQSSLLIRAVCQKPSFCQCAEAQAGLSLCCLQNL